MNPISQAQPDGYKPTAVPQALKALRGGAMKMEGKLPDLTPVVAEFGELKLAGIPCISLNEMGAKYRHAKEGLLSSSKYLPHVVDHQVHYGIWPQVDLQNNAEGFAYILCVEVERFDGIPDWYVKITIPPHRCVAVASYDGHYDAAGEVIGRYLRENGLTETAEGYDFTICERYRYEKEGFARLSLPIVRA